MYNIDDLDLEKIKKNVEYLDGTKFPSKIYTDYVLKPAYNEAKANFLEIMMKLNKAQLVMLLEQSIISKEDAIKIKNAIDGLNLDEVRRSEYDGKYEDLFFHIEDLLLKSAGECAGNLHIARSRNDMAVAVNRLTIRPKLLSLLDAIKETHLVVTAFAKKHKSTLMIAHTHSQQAQPTTLGHYMVGATDVMARDMERIKQAYISVNRSSLGAAAITTSGFNISRQRMVELTGFNELITNSYDCIGGGDYLGEVATSVNLAAINLGRIVHDMLLFSINEMNVYKVAAPYIQISSIMPQKRNPVSIEHMRVKLSVVSGECQTVLTMLHNTPYGDINDTEDSMQTHVWKAVDTLKDTYKLLHCVISTMEVNTDILEKRAYESLAVITELADTLTREEKIPFRKAHSVASEIVNMCLSENRDRGSIKFEDIARIFKTKVGREIMSEKEKIMESLDPYNFVKVRTVTGGPAEGPMNEMLKLSIEKTNKNQDWLKEKLSQIEEANKKLNDAYEQII